MDGFSSFRNGEILNIDKPSGLTSTAVVRRIKKWSGCAKVGHAGTLDPFATGVLLVCTGSATKQVNRLIEYDKEYEGEVVLGKQTTTDDPEGDIIRSEEVPAFTEDRIRSTLAAFIGEIEQIPPVYSALKVKGRRMYELARSGKEVKREPRKVQVYSIDLIQWERPSIHVRIRCGRGTYIRAIARDIGLKLETGGYLKSLKRTRVGPYRVEKSLSLTYFEKICRIEDERLQISR